MIKQLGKHDRLVSPFVAAKQWALSNVDPQDVVLMETTGSEEPVALEFKDYSAGCPPTVNRDCNIALEQQPSDLAIPEAGVSGSGHFFPDSELTNQKTNSYKRLVYDQIQKAFYNDYRNPLKIFGIDNIDFPLSRTDRFIGNEFLMFSIPRCIFGDRLAETTIRMYDANFNDNMVIRDDGEGNLIAGVNLFSKVQEVRAFGNILNTGSVIACQDYFWNENSASWDTEYAFWNDCNLFPATGSDTGSPVPPPTHSMSASAVAWWPFEDGLNGPWQDVYLDSFSTDFIKDPFSVTGNQYTVPGLVGDALHFDGENGAFSTNVNSRSSSVELLYTSSGFTYTTWFRVPSIHPNQIGFFYRGYRGGFGPPFIAPVTQVVAFTPFWVSSSNRWTVTLTDASNTDVLNMTASFSPVLGEWYLLRFSYDYENGKIIYSVNDEPEIISTGSYSFFTSSMVSARLQMRLDSKVGGTNMEVDEFNFWDTVLSSSQVLELYNSGSGRTAPPAMPVAPGCLTYASQFRITQSAPLSPKDYTRPRYAAASTNPSVKTMVVSDNELSGSDQHNSFNWFYTTQGVYLNRYTASYIHTWPKRNAVFANNKYYMMSDGLNFRISDFPVTASDMLVFDRTGSLLSTIPLTHGGIDWDTDGKSVYIFENDGDKAYIEEITASSDTSISVTNILDYGNNPVSMSQTAFGAWGMDAAYYQGVMEVFVSGSTTLKIVNVLAPNGIETGSGDHLWLLSGSKMIADAEYFDGFYQGYQGCTKYCPLTNKLHIGVYGPAPDYAPFVLETDLNFNLSHTYDLSPYTASGVFTVDQILYVAKNETMVFYCSYPPIGGGDFVVADPIDHTVYCLVEPFPLPSPFTCGTNAAVDSFGKLYTPQRIDGSSFDVTGSVKIYRV